jgi:CRISPR-associated protein Cst2
MYPPYVRLSARVNVEVSVLTGSGTIGNYNAHAMATVIFKKDSDPPRVYEIPVITGNALKHWHSIYLAETYEALGGRYLNDLCKRGIGARGYTVDSTLVDNKLKVAESEADAIKDLCNDIHGFLNPDQQIKRDSLVKVSFGVPVLEEEILEAVSKYSVIHNRVIPKEVSGKVEMMIFKQEYSSILYGLSISMNLGMTLRPMYSGREVSGIQNLDYERKLRIKASILALLPLLLGSASKQARALPISRVEETLLVVSQLPVPNIVHASYPDYIERSIELVRGYVSGVSGESKVSNLNTYIYCYSRAEARCPKEGIMDNVIQIKRFNDLGMLIREAADIASNMIK